MARMSSGTREAKKTLRNESGDHRAGRLDEALTSLRALYMVEVERFAEELRPRFLSGELRPMTHEDGERMLAAKAAGSSWEPPFYKLERICAKRFGGSERLALLSTACASQVPWGPWTEARWMAGNAVALDVLAVARDGGWLVPGDRSATG